MHSQTIARHPADVTGVDLAAYFTNDPSASIAFYRDVIGLTPTELDDQGRGAEFELADGSTFGVWKDDDVVAPGAAMMFAVGDIAAAVARIRERGAKIADAIETNVCFMAMGMDPDGNPYIIHQRKPGAAGTDAA